MSKRGGGDGGITSCPGADPEGVVWGEGGTHTGSGGTVILGLFVKPIH